MSASNGKNRKKTRVAVVIPKYGLVGGGERFAAELTGRLASDGRFDIHVFANKWAEGRSSGVTFHKVPTVGFPRFLRPLSFAHFAAKATVGFDLVHSHERLIGADIYSVHCVPHAGWVRDVRRKKESLFDKAVISVERRMMSTGGNALFLPVSTLAIDAFRAEYGSLPGTWRPLHPGVDVKRFSSVSRPECRKEVRGRHNMDDDDFIVLFVGMNFEVKGLSTMIRALALARKKSEERIRLLVVGRGDERKYSEMAEEAGVGDSVVFAGTRSEGLERYYRASDCLMMLSTFDTFGMVVLEAMASSLPVVVSSGVGAKDLVKEGANGFVISDPLDAEAAAERLLRLLDRKKRDEMGSNALKTALENDWDSLAKTMGSFYMEALEKKRRPSSGGQT